MKAYHMVGICVLAYLAVVAVVGVLSRLAARVARQRERRRIGAERAAKAIAAAERRRASRIDDLLPPEVAAYYEAEFAALSDDPRPGRTNQ